MRRRVRRGHLGIDEPDHPAVGVDAVGQNITADGVLVGVVDVVGCVGEERDEVRASSASRAAVARASS